MWGHSGPFTTGAWELLRRVQLSANAAAVEFANLPQCRAFRLTATGVRRSTGSTASISNPRVATLTLNGDNQEGNGHYSYLQRMAIVESNGALTPSDSASVGQDAMVVFRYLDLGSDAARVSDIEIIITDTPNRYKTLRSEMVLAAADGFSQIAIAGTWVVTERIHTIRIDAFATSFATGSLFVLEGIR